MLTLAIETSGQSGGAALSLGSHPVAEVSMSSMETHSRRLIPSIKWLMDSAGIMMKELECIATSLGPGSFTGLRIGIATARGLSFALKIPLVGIPTFDVVAHNIPPVPGLALCPVVDARKSHVYTTCYLADHAGWNRAMPFQLASPDELHEMFIRNGVLQSMSDGHESVSRIIFLGDGINLYRDTIEAAFSRMDIFFTSEHLWAPRPMSLAVIARRYLEKQIVDSCSSSLEPIYIRPSQAEEKKGNLSETKISIQPRP